MVEIISQNGHQQRMSVTLGGQHINLTGNIENLEIIGNGVLELNPNQNNLEIGGLSIIEGKISLDPQNEITSECREIFIYNLSNEHTIKIKNQSIGSLDRNRFLITPSLLVDDFYSLQPKTAAHFLYMEERWCKTL